MRRLPRVTSFDWVVPVSLDCLMTLALGFSVAGMLATGYETLVRQRLGLSPLGRGPSLLAFATIALLVFAAPFVMLRHAVGVVLTRQSGIEFVMITTAVAAFWSLMSGVAVLLMLQSTGVLTV
jgi:hypothetical protein